MSGTKPEKKRELSEKEKRRAEIVKAKLQNFEAQGCTVTELTIGQARANMMALLFCLPPILLFVVLWLCRNPFSAETTRSIAKPLILLAAVLLSFPVHEAIHGLCWVIFAEDHEKSIEFGITKDFYTPYCTCTTPMSLTQYCIGAVMPGLILGVIPCILSIFMGEFYMLEFGCVGLLGAGADLQSIFRILSYKSGKKTKFCIDHPTEIGMIIIEK